MDKADDLIVLVEDDVSLQRALHRLLQAAGYRVLPFVCGEDLLATPAAVMEAGCMVLDVELPGVSGPACYASLREPRPPVVFITAYDCKAVRALAGANEVLPKPFNGEALLRIVRALMGQGPS